METGTANDGWLKQKDWARLALGDGRVWIPISGRYIDVPDAKHGSQYQAISHAAMGQSIGAFETNGPRLLAGKSATANSE